MSLPVIYVGETTFPITPNPAPGRYYLGVDQANGHLKKQDSTGTILDYDTTAGVTEVTVTTNDGVSAVVTNPNTTPDIKITLGNIIPTLVTCSKDILARTILRLTNGPDGSTGVGSVFLGRNTGTTQTTGSENIGIGTSALGQVTTGLQNIAIGFQALVGVITAAANNIAIGYQAGRSTTGSSNIAVGTNSLYSNTSSSENTTVGVTSLFNNTGARNTAVGFNAGLAQVALNACVYLGYKAGALNTTLSNVLYIGNTDTGTGSKLITGKFDTEQVGINVTPDAIAASAVLDINSTTKGFLPPRMTTAQRLAISSPTAGLIVFDSTIGELYEYTTEWEMLPKDNPAYYSITQDDWVGGTTASLLNWTTTINGAAAASALATTGVNSTLKAQGVISLSTGTTNTGRTAINTSANMALGFTKINKIWRAYIPVLSDGTNTFAAFFGLGDTPAGAGIAQTHAVAFVYDSTVSANWICRSTVAGVSTSTTTTVAVDTNFNKFEIEINEAGTQVLFKINNTTVATHTTNIPAAGQFIGPLAKISKSVGGTARLIYFDYFWQKLTWSSSR